MLIVFLAKYLIALPVILAVCYAFVTSRKREFITYAVLVFIVSYALAFVAGHLYYNPRPFVVENVAPLVAHAADNGFPSEHTLLVAAIAAIVTPFAPLLGAFLWLLALLVGLGRVLALVHHPIDIIASLLIAIFSAFVVWRLRSLGGPHLAVGPPNFNKGHQK